MDNSIPSTVSPDGNIYVPRMDANVNYCIGFRDIDTNPGDGADMRLTSLAYNALTVHGSFPSEANFDSKYASVTADQVLVTTNDQKFGFDAEGLIAADGPAHVKFSCDDLKKTKDLINGVLPDAKFSAGAAIAIVEDGVLKQTNLPEHIHPDEITFPKGLTINKRSVTLLPDNGIGDPMIIDWNSTRDGEKVTATFGEFIEVVSDREKYKTVVYDPTTEKAKFIAGSILPVYLKGSEISFEDPQKPRIGDGKYTFVAQDGTGDKTRVSYFADGEMKLYDPKLVNAPEHPFVFTQIDGNGLSCNAKDKSLVVGLDGFEYSKKGDDPLDPSFKFTLADMRRVANLTSKTKPSDFDKSLLQVAYNPSDGEYYAMTPAEYILKDSISFCGTGMDKNGVYLDQGDGTSTQLTSAGLTNILKAVAPLTKFAAVDDDLPVKVVIYDEKTKMIGYKEDKSKLPEYLKEEKISLPGVEISPTGISFNGGSSGVEGGVGARVLKHSSMTDGEIYIFDPSPEAEVDPLHDKRFSKQTFDTTLFSNDIEEFSVGIGGFRYVNKVNPMGDVKNPIRSYVISLSKLRNIGESFTGAEPGCGSSGDGSSGDGSGCGSSGDGSGAEPGAESGCGSGVKELEVLSKTLTALVEEGGDSHEIVCVAARITSLSSKIVANFASP